MLPFEVVENEARAAGGAHFAQLRSQTAQAVEAWQALGQVVDQHASADAPPTSRVRDLLEQIHDVAKRFTVAETGLAEEAPAAALEQAAEVEIKKNFDQALTFQPISEKAAAEYSGSDPNNATGQLELGNARLIWHLPRIV